MAENNKAAGFEASLERLEEIVRALESDAVTLDESVALFKEGRDVARRCEQMLKTAQETIEAVDAGTGPDARTAPAASLFDDDSRA